MTSAETLSLVRCPVHERLAVRAGSGRIVVPCRDCVREADAARKKLDSKGRRS